MRAVVYRGTNRIRVQNVPEPVIRDDRDAIVRVVLSSICGTDIHLVNGRIPGMVSGTVLGHECVGVIEQVGSQIKHLSKGDRVVVLSTIGCGSCRYCSHGHYAHCENTPVGPSTYFFGGPAEAGSLAGMQAELVRVPYADVGCIRIPDALDDVAALALSDIFPTAYFGVEAAKVENGQTVVIVGAGPVGQMAVVSAHMKGAGKIVVIDREAARLELAAQYPEVETIDFSSWRGPVKRAKRILEDRHGADCVIDCVGVDAASPWGFNAPQKPLEYASELVRPEGTVSIIGLYPEVVAQVPFGAFLEKNVRIVGGNCHHRSHVDEPLEYLLQHPEEGRRIFTHRAPLDRMPEAYEAFVEKEDGMVKCVLEVSERKLEAIVPTAAAAAHR